MTEMLKHRKFMNPVFITGIVLLASAIITFSLIANNIAKHSAQEKLFDYATSLAGKLEYSQNNVRRMMQMLSKTPGLERFIRTLGDELRSIDEKSFRSSFRKQLSDRIINDYKKASPELGKLTPQKFLTLIPDEVSSKMVQSKFLSGNKANDEFLADYMKLYSELHPVFEQVRLSCGAEDILLIEAGSMKVVYSSGKYFALGDRLLSSKLKKSGLSDLPLKIARQSGNISFVDFTTNHPLNPSPNAYVGIAVGHDKQIAGYIVLRLSAAHFSNLINVHQTAPSGANALLVGEDMMLRSIPLAFIQDNNQYIQSRQFSEQEIRMISLNGSPLSVEYVDIEDNEIAVTYKDSATGTIKLVLPLKVYTENWKLITSLSSGKIVSTYYTSFWVLIPVGVIMFLFLIIMTIYYENRVERPLTTIINLFDEATKNPDSFEFHTPSPFYEELTDKINDYNHSQIEHRKHVNQFTGTVTAITTDLKQNLPQPLPEAIAESANQLSELRVAISDFERLAYSKDTLTRKSQESINLAYSKLSKLREVTATNDLAEHLEKISNKLNLSVSEIPRLPESILTDIRTLQESFTNESKRQNMLSTTLENLSDRFEVSAIARQKEATNKWEQQLRKLNENIEALRILILNIIIEGGTLKNPASNITGLGNLMKQNIKACSSILDTLQTGNDNQFSTISRELTALLRQEVSTLSNSLGGGSVETNMLLAQSILQKLQHFEREHSFDPEPVTTMIDELTNLSENRRKNFEQVLVNFDIDSQSDTSADNSESLTEQIKNLKSLIQYDTGLDAISSYSHAQTRLRTRIEEIANQLDDTVIKIQNDMNVSSVEDNEDSENDDAPQQESDTTETNE
ncbi:MAG: hypothetical protein K8S56_04675 [Candidatus Cloacimonetes bacterium]|nr:hypothetical protein [Candidatus Cloacimonadota bacterium]